MTTGEQYETKETQSSARIQGQGRPGSDQGRQDAGGACPSSLMSIRIRSRPGEAITGAGGYRVWQQPGAQGRRRGPIEGSACQDRRVGPGE